MTPTRFRIVKHLTATLFAVTMAGLLVLGLDSVLGAMHKLKRLFAAAPPPAPSEARAAAAPATPGMMPAFVVPAADAAPGQPSDSNRK